MTSQVSRRSLFAGSTSLGVHAALIVCGLVLAGLRTAHAPALELTPIEIVDVVAPAPGPEIAGSREGASNAAQTGVPGKQGHDAPKRSFTQAPAKADPRNDVVIGYDAPDNADSGRPDGTTGSGLGIGLTGFGAGAGSGFGHGGDGDGIPEPPRSHARPPRPKNTYLTYGLPAVHEYAGKAVVVKLIIDSNGAVRKVSVLSGVTPKIDRQAVEIAQAFDFYPALLANGVPRWGTFRWDFVIVDDEDDLDGQPEDYYRRHHLKHKPRQLLQKYVAPPPPEDDGTA